jgi:DMSO/TMAO reductase YedYZ molybdopterin-dependent catalytic subunit
LRILETKVKRVLPKIFAGFVIAILLVLIAIVAFESFQPPKLYPSEVRDYKGENLSSISSIADNAIRGTQYLNASTYSMQVTGLVNRTTQYSYDQLLSGFQAYQKVVTLHCVEGWSAKILWEGFLVSDLLNVSGVKPNAVAAIFYAADGYSTELPLDYLSSHNILIAYKMNGVTLPPEKGFPFQLVAESQYGYKWIKWITRIELTDNPDYLGTWESRGYPNNATIP